MISYLLPLSSQSGSLIYPMIWLAKAAVSIQRLYEYAKWNHHEKQFNTPKAPHNWPNEGKIEAKNLSIRYRKGLPLVLNGIDFTIEPGQKVAIIGRTGSGKSTTLLAMMRILEMAKDRNRAELGSIEIDGVNIGSVGLHELRGRLSIIPQDPFLMQGTLKFNVDPSGEMDDFDIIDILKDVSALEGIREQDVINQRIQELKERGILEVEKMSENEKNELAEGFKSVDEYILTTIHPDDDPEIKRIKEEGVSDHDKIHLKIEEKGSNLSIGQRQLVCIARALIKRPKVLLMDEATANIDQKTDSIIQNLIKNRLNETTVVTIAHRLITVVQYDKIIILEKGQKIEEGSPRELLEDEGSFFTKMVMEGGKEFRRKMKLAANDFSLDPAVLFAQ